MNARECLQVLNLDSSANNEDLKHAYRKAVQHWHPDRYQQANAKTRSAAEQQMQLLNTAYKILTEFYDEHGYMPGHVPPLEEEETVTKTASYTSSVNDAGTRHDTSEAYSKTGYNTRTTKTETEPTPKPKQAGKVWFTLGIFVLLSIYYFGDFSGDQIEQTERAVTTVKENTPQDTVQSTTPAHTDNQTTSTKTDDKAAEEDDSPFTAKERKSAFEQTSKLGIYTESPDDNFFTYGDTAGRVFEVQGVPTKTDGDTWYYGKSEVHFRDGRVKSWYMAKGSRLKAKKQR